MRKIVGLIAIVLLTAACSKDNSKITYQELIERMTDMRRLAQLPVNGEKSGMFSSYDRKSKYDTATASYVDWAANNDGFSPQYIRKEGENMVLAEMDGPGAIVRIWSASPKKGHVKIFIDGNKTPIIDLPFIDYFDTNGLPIFKYPNLVYETAARGYNNYVPITFQKSIKIVGEPGWGQYYQFNYITFPEESVVEKFNADPSPEIEESLHHTNNILGKNPEMLISDIKKGNSEKNKQTIKPGEIKNVIQIDGKRAITFMKIKLGEIAPDKEAEAYRKTILSIKWDGATEDAVWSPIGDFFGSAPGFNNYTTMVMGMSEKGMHSNWYMPFSKQALISVQNTTDFDIELEIEIRHEKIKENPDNLGYFHAKWHRDIMPVEKERWPDWTLLKTKGSGRFVGMFLSVWNPKGGSCREFAEEGFWWWGEGDEKFFVDGEKFPSTFGTGTEDYFGYAWCMPNYFQRAYHSQNFTDGNMGYQSLNRWQIIDNVPFTKSFEAYLEKYFPNTWPTQYATVVYWYLNNTGGDLIGATPTDELFGYEIPYNVYYMENAVEAENLQFNSNTAEKPSDGFAHESLYNSVSGHKFITWIAKKEGEIDLEATFNLNREGNYNVYANVLTSKEGGVFSLSLNGKKLKNEINCYSNNNTQKTKLLHLGTVEMVKGQQEVTFSLLKTDRQGNKMLLDCLKFEPLK